LLIGREGDSSLNHDKQTYDAVIWRMNISNSVQHVAG